MIVIKKHSQPNSLIKYKKSEKYPTYETVPTDIKNDIKHQLIDEQGYICAYCMKRIQQDDTSTIEHYIPRNGKYGNPDEQLEYNNLLAVCDGNRGSKNLTCDASKGSDLITVNPLNENSIQQIKYKSDGTIYSDNKKINHDLDVTLNLNYITIKSNRKSALDALKKKLINAKNTGNWSNIARKYYNQLKQSPIKSPYVGILLNYLEKHL